MRTTRRATWLMVLAAIALGYCVLGFYQDSEAAPGNAGEPFANSVRQRAEMVSELKAIRKLLTEQNALLREGKLTVTIKGPGANRP